MNLRAVQQLPREALPGTERRADAESCARSRSAGLGALRADPGWPCSLRAGIAVRSPICRHKIIEPGAFYLAPFTPSISMTAIAWELDVSVSRLSRLIARAEGGQKAKRDPVPAYLVAIGIVSGGGASLIASHLLKFRWRFAK